MATLTPTVTSNQSLHQAIPSAAYTTAQTSSVLPNQSPEGYLLVYLNVTAASGTGGLQLKVYGVDPVSGVAAQINATPTAVTATGIYAYALGPSVSSAAGDVKQATQTFVPQQFQFVVTAGDSSSYTYSVGYSFSCLQ